MKDSTTDLYNRLPRFIKDILVVSEGWLVGSAVTKVNPKDYDIVIPEPIKFQNTLIMLCGHKLSLNTFGGIKYLIDGCSVDIWTQSLGSFISTQKTGKMYNLKSRILLTVEG